MGYFQRIRVLHNVHFLTMVSLTGTGVLYPCLWYFFYIVFRFCWLPFWSSSILVIFYFGCLPFWSSSILVQKFSPPHFDLKTSFNVFTDHSNAGEKCSFLPFWFKIFLRHTLIPRPALMYSQFTAMLVKTIGKVVFLFGRGQFTNQDSYSVALLLLTVSYFRVKKFLPLTLHSINTLEISTEKAFQLNK